MRTWTSTVRLTLVSATSLVLMACGNEVEVPLDPVDFDPIPSSIPATPGGVMLPGDPARPAMDAVVDMPQSPAPGADRFEDYLTSRLEAWLAPDATIGDVNAVLEGHDAAVLSMMAGVPLLTLVVPPAADVDALRSLAQTIQATEPFMLVLPAMTTDPPATDVGPHPRGPDGPLRLTPQNDSVPSHLVAARSPAAWNARSAALTVGAPVSVLVADFFSSLTPHPEVSAMSFPPGVTGSATPNSNHGWHVAGTVAADFGGNAAVGIHPEAPSLVDLEAIPVSGLSWAGVTQAIIARMPATGNFVVNTSLGWGIAAMHGVNGGNWTADQLMAGIQLGLAWRIAVANRTDRFIHATAAGNERTYAGTMNRADLVSIWTMAARFDDIRDALPDGLLSTAERQSIDFFWAAVTGGNPAAATRLENTIIVGSSNAFGTESSFSNADPDLRATGEDVVNVCRAPDAGCDGSLATMDGTSMATPQVAGMAAWLWNLRPTWTSAEVRERIVAAYDLGLTDHYTMTLATDGGPNDAPVRRAILDVAGSGGDPGTNGLFDEMDVALYLQMFASYDIARETDPRQDHSRFDLNGDGYTDDSSLAVGASFDLDFDRLAIGTASYEAGGDLVDVEEANPTDLEVLCYYAYSDLYDGDESERDELLANCLPPGLGGVTLDTLALTLSEGLAQVEASAWDQQVAASGTSDECHDEVVPDRLDPSIAHELDLECAASATHGRASASASASGSMSITPEIDADRRLSELSWSAEATSDAAAGGLSGTFPRSEAGANATATFPLRADITVRDSTALVVSGTTDGGYTRVSVDGPAGTMWFYVSGDDGNQVNADLTLAPGQYRITVLFNVTIYTTTTGNTGVVDDLADGSMDVTMTFRGRG